MKSKIERWFPILLGFLIACLSSFIPGVLSIERFAGDLFSSTVNLGGVMAGFMIAAMSIIFSIDEKHILRQLKFNNTYEKLINYFLDSIFWSFFLVICSVGCLITDFKTVSIWQICVFYVWIISLVIMIASSFRVMYLLSEILKDPR
jgi:TRAP-type C4-dicarboxylate transport system permease large subunit